MGQFNQVVIPLKMQRKAPFDLARDALLNALEECRPIIESGTASSISFVIPFDTFLGTPKKAIWRMEGEHNLGAKQERT